MSGTNKGYKKILVIRTDRIGDVALSTPVLKALRDAFPSAYIAVMVRPYANDIVEGNPYIDEVILYDKEGKEKSVLGTLSFAVGLRKKRFDLVIVMHPANRAHIAAFLSGAKQRIGYDRKLSFLLTHKVKHEKQLGIKHEVEYTLDMLRAIGIAPEAGRIYMPVKESDIEAVEQALKDKGVSPNDRLVCVHPGASCPSKRMPAETFAEAADRLMETYGVKIAVIAGPKDIEYGKRVMRLLKRSAADFSGKTTVGELAALLKRCELLISNDSGPVHIATAVGTPNVTIFGRKQPGLGPKRWGPTGEADVILHKDTECDICLAHNCEKGFLCLRAVTADEVYEAAARLLGVKYKMIKKMPSEV